MFETTLVVDGVPRDLDDHLARLAVSAEMTGMVVPGPDEWRRAVAAAVKAWDGGRRDGAPAGRQPRTGVGSGAGLLRRWARALSPVSLRQRVNGVRVLLLNRGFTAASAEAAPWLLAGAKTLSYGVNMAALRHAAANNADDVIFVGADGGVLEAPTASVVVARGRALLTPPAPGILDGITVRRLFRVAADAGWATDAAVLTAADLHAADGVWLASSARLLAPVIAIDGIQRSDGGMTAELSALLEVPVSPDGPDQPLTAPALAPRTKYRWKMKNTMATGIVISRAAAIFSGNCVPPPSCPLTKVATPEVNVFSSGLCREMMKCGSSFQEAWNDRMVKVMTAGRAIGRTAPVAVNSGRTGVPRRPAFTRSISSRSEAKRRSITVRISEPDRLTTVRLSAIPATSAVRRRRSQTDGSGDAITQGPDDADELRAVRPDR